MAKKTVQYYENLMQETLRALNRESPIRTDVSFDIQNTQMSIKINRAINVLMEEYLRKPVVLKKFFGFIPHPKQPTVDNQTIIAKKIQEKMSNSATFMATGESLSAKVITLLEAGLFANNLHPDDNFPKIVQAIFNKTNGLKDWKFSESVKQKFSVANEKLPAENAKQSCVVG